MGTFSEKNILGITGTRFGCTKEQLISVKTMLLDLTPTTIHHGDCVGVDAEIDKLARTFDITRVIHPPADPYLRAWCFGAETREAEPYLIRNQNIVSETELLLCVPSTVTEEVRSGTWFTVRYARTLNRPIIFVFPDGAIGSEG